MFTVTRRWVLKALVVSGLSSLFPGRAFSTSSQSLFHKNMEALTDAIIPGAVALGIHEKVKESILKAPNKMRLCTTGLDTIEHYSQRHYKKSFHLLDDEQKDAVLRWMDDMPGDKTGGYFLKKYRETVLAYYYTDPKVWKTLRYDGPPQPRGFMDYHLPPKVNHE